MRYVKLHPGLICAAIAAVAGALVVAACTSAPPPAEEEPPATRTLVIDLFADAPPLYADIPAPLALSECREGPAVECDEGPCHPLVVCIEPESGSPLWFNQYLGTVDLRVRELPPFRKDPCTSNPDSLAWPRWDPPVVERLFSAVEASVRRTPQEPTGFDARSGGAVLTCSADPIAEWQ